MSLKYHITCECGEFRKGVDEIDACIMFCSTHSFAPQYHSKPFQFCPWCGRELKDLWKEEQKQEEDIDRYEACPKNARAAIAKAKGEEK